MVCPEIWTPLFIFGTLLNVFEMCFLKLSEFKIRRVLTKPAVICFSKQGNRPHNLFHNERRQIDFAQLNNGVLALGLCFL